MESVVPPQITAELTQILSNLVLGDNEIRSNAEKAVNERLATTPELYLLALAQFAISADTDVMRSFSLVLLRRLLFRPAPSTQTSQHHSIPSARLTLYDHLSHQTISNLERILLFSLSHETATTVRRKAVDTVCDLANQGMARGKPWHALQAQSFSMTHAQGPERGVPGPQLRETAYRIFAGCPNLVMDLQVDAVLGVFQRGLQDPESIEVRQAALLASVAYLSTADAGQLSQSISLLGPMLDTLPPLANSLSQPPLGAHDSSSPKSSNYHYLSTFLSTLTPLCSSHPILFAPHLQSLLTFLPALILPAVDCGPTPTVGRPFPTSSGSGNGNGARQGAFVFPPPGSSSSSLGDGEREGSPLVGVKTKYGQEVPGWTEVIVRACLEGMGEFEEDERDGLETWLREDPSSASSSAETDSPPALYEQSLDRLACAMGGRSVLPPAFQAIPSMMASYDWRVRHAGLMAIAAIGEGTGKVMQKELEKIVDLVTPMFNDSHPRVRYAACQCIVHAHAAAALINFCEGVERETLLPYLDPIVERLLKLLNPGGDQAQVRRYVQEQAITTLAMVADASEITFGKHYPTIMPLLLNVLRNADSPDYQKLRVKAMECAGLIAIAVGPDVFRPDSKTLVELLMRIQQSPVDPNDTQLSHYLIATWAKVCQAMGQEFEPYLPVVMPSLLATASAKADLSVYDEEDENAEDREGWETIVMDGQTYGVRTSAMDEKCQAFETLTLEVTLPCLRFYFHEGVREACAMLIPMLLSCGKQSGTLTNQMVSATFLQLINCISSEHDSTFLASLYKYFSEALLVVGGPEALSPQFHEGIMEATKRQLHSLADKRKSRAARASSNAADFDRDEMALIEEIEDFALEDMGKMLLSFDSNHPLLVAVSSVRELGLNTYDSDEDVDDEG
ncbi:hypothetical protein NLJ89_g7010 [Agrocybe chaxingu]|uniref:ARM repeat-containing protein n=1 Tax=Agrocybe chaxingu TaxID=84603 RepID=A0A9W8MU38_9AGAR|nr:hypothetical protein NLJ89_g7010 [Agrocybe chaxingu]